jgi:MFS family permease
MTRSGASAWAEWRAFGTLPIAAALCHSTAVLHVYSLGAFMAPLQEEFGWSRAQISLGITVVGITGALLSVPVGALVDRLGPRLVGLAGAFLMVATFALLGTATGGDANWIVLWALVALGNLGLQATVLVTAVSCRFAASRGLAFAVTLSGASVGAMIIPVLTTWLIGALGWRGAFPALAGIWALVAWPIIFLFFRAEAPRVDRKAPASAARPAMAGLSIGDGLRSRGFYLLLAASMLFTVTSMGVIVHFVPILTGAGTDPLDAARTASVIGLASLAGRIGTGMLLDRFSGRIVGGSILVLPIVGALLLLAAGTTPAAQIVAGLCFGLTLGAEVDVVAYLATQQFGMKSYGILFGFINAGLALGVALGPVLAGETFDTYGDYTPFLYLTAGLTALSSLALFSLPEPRAFPAVADHKAAILGE